MVLHHGDVFMSVYYCVLFSFYHDMFKILEKRLKYETVGQ